MTTEDYNYLKTYNFDAYEIDYDTRVIMLNIYNRVMNQDRKMTTCNTCWIEIISMVRNHYNNHVEELKNKKKK